MNQGFKTRFDQLRENNPTGSDNAPVWSDNERYPSPGYGRNMGLLWPDGKRAFLNYAYLIVGEFEPNEERNVIKLNFSSHRVTLHGYCLESLFMALLDHLPRMIVAIDDRYVLEEDKNREIVIEMTMVKNED